MSTIKYSLNFFLIYCSSILICFILLNFYFLFEIRSKLLVLLLLLLLSLCFNVKFLIIYQKYNNKLIYVNLIIFIINFFYYYQFDFNFKKVQLNFHSLSIINYNFNLLNLFIIIIHFIFNYRQIYFFLIYLWKNLTFLIIQKIILKLKKKLRSYYL